ncbi:translation initiation factor 2 subunit 3 [Strigomonas culicis]|nr:translation initiation factor 2 subunit 3 [Strigomonas culicis]|eukprot:EPY19522.1 translation initiation factor 2 subunit 3 [Strigomonas culicis]
MQLLRHFSFVDCPGHEVLMATMLNGAAIMDAALLLIAANEPFPQPQTLEHLKAVEIMRMRHLIVLQNKIDLVSEVQAQDQYAHIRDYMDGLGQTSPILPISAQLGFNINFLMEYLAHIPVPVRQLKEAVRMSVVRSFDINRPSERIEDLQGGVAGGTLTQGILKVDQLIEIRPGRVKSCTNGTAANRTYNFVYSPIRTHVTSLRAENNELKFAIPGGLIAVCTKVDPTQTRQDKLIGNVIGDEGTLPEVYCEVEVEYTLLTEMLGVKESRKKVQKLDIGQSLQLNVGTLTAGGRVLDLATSPPIVKVRLDKPVCCCIMEKVAISRVEDVTFRLIGWGEFRRGVPLTSGEC